MNRHMNVVLNVYYIITLYRHSKYKELHETAERGLLLKQPANNNYSKLLVFLLGTIISYRFVPNSQAISGSFVQTST